MQKKLRMRIAQHWQLYLFLLVPLAYLIVFHYVPMAGVQIAFKKFKISQGIWGSPWVGLANFRRFFSSYYFGRVIRNTLSLSLFGLVAGFPMPILLALLLNAMPSARYRKTVQMVLYVPHFISTVVMVGMLLQFLNPLTGFVGTMGRLLGVTNPVNLMGKPSAFRYVYVLSGIWQNMGWSSIIYMSALSSSDIQIHEAMQIDGANRFQRVLHADFPCVLPTAIILLILNAGSIMNIGYEKVYLMQNNMNLSASEVISTHVFKVGLQGATADYAYGAAVGLFNSVINFALLVVINWISRRVSATSLW